MRRGAAVEYVLFFLAAACFVVGFQGGRSDAPPPPPDAPLEGALRVMTWNVGGGLDGRIEALQDEDLGHVASVLRDLAPDLCFLQEIRSARQAQLLARELGSEWSHEVSRGRRGRLVIALCRGGEIAPRDLGLPRETLAVSHRSAAGGELCAVGVHADAFSSRSRNELLGAVCDRLSETEETARLLVGDLNLDLDLDKRRDLFSDDAYLDVETYNYVAEHLLDTAMGSGATAQPDRRLDYVFAGGFRVRAAGPIRDRRLGNMDHDPLVVDLVRVP